VWRAVAGSRRVQHAEEERAASELGFDHDLVALAASVTDGIRDEFARYKHCFVRPLLVDFAFVEEAPHERSRLTDRMRPSRERGPGLGCWIDP
jgi:hypothetical protein